MSWAQEIPPKYLKAWQTLGREELRVRLEPPASQPLVSLCRDPSSESLHHPSFLAGERKATWPGFPTVWQASECRREEPYSQSDWMWGSSVAVC